MVAQPLAALGTPHALWGSRRRPRPLLTVALVCSEPREGAAWFLPPQWEDEVGGCAPILGASGAQAGTAPPGRGAGEGTESPPVARRPVKLQRAVGGT